MLKKSIRFLSLLFGATLIAFLLVSFAPIDPVQQYVASHGVVSGEQRKEIAAYFGLNQGLFTRYMHWLLGIFHGNFGESFIYRIPVLQVIGERAGNSFLLMFSSWVLSGCFGYILGIYMGMKQDSWADRFLKKTLLVFKFSSNLLAWIIIIDVICC